MLHKSALTIVSLAVTTVLLSGCASKPKPPVLPPPPTGDQVSSIREAFKQISPAAKIGVVSAVLTETPYAMVSDIETEGLKPGDIITFVDGTQTTIAHGKIVRTVDPTKIAVEYTAGIRTPLVGDVAVKF